MKSIPVVLSFLTNPQRRRNIFVLARLVAMFSLLVLVFTITFHYVMAWEGRQYSWATGVYWVLVVMSTLGFGDITFESDAGRIFSVVVLLSGTVFLLVLLPFMFIQFFYVPWMEAQAAARAPRTLSAKTAGHVILTGVGAVEAALIRLLDRSQRAYVVLVAELIEALRLHDEGYRVMLGDLDDPETYNRARAGQDQHGRRLDLGFRTGDLKPAAVPDAHHVHVGMIAQADVLQAAADQRRVPRRGLGDQQLTEPPNDVRLGIASQDSPGQPLAQHLGELQYLVTARQLQDVDGSRRGRRGSDGHRLGDLADRERHVGVGGVRAGGYDQGRLAGSREQLDAYDELFCIYERSDKPVVIIGGGHVGRAVAATLLEEGIDYRIVERQPEQVLDPERVITGDAAELEILQKAGIMETASVVITTHDDDMNVYLTIYCRRLRPNIHILGRANLERNVSTLHRAGADFVMSYASTGANVLFNLLKSADILLLAEGLDAFRIPMPEALAGRSLAESGIRETTGCNVVAVVQGDRFDVNPDARQLLPANADLVVIGDIESETRFFSKFDL
jgi:Trk K+ transport system NAD-binding subunit